MKALVAALCRELDPDLSEILMGDAGGGYKYWQLIENPLSTAIAWQQMRRTKNAP